MAAAAAPYLRGARLQHVCTAGTSSARVLKKKTTTAVAKRSLTSMTTAAAAAAAAGPGDDTSTRHQALPSPPPPPEQQQQQQQQLQGGTLRANSQHAATAMTWSKNDLRHTSAVVLVPPPELWVGPYTAVH